MHLSSLLSARRPDRSQARVRSSIDKQNPGSTTNHTLEYIASALQNRAGISWRFEGNFPRSWDHASHSNVFWQRNVLEVEEQAGTARPSQVRGSGHENRSSLHTPWPGESTIWVSLKRVQTLHKHRQRRLVHTMAPRTRLCKTS